MKKEWIDTQKRKNKINKRKGIENERSRGTSRERRNNNGKSKKNEKNERKKLE